MFQDSQASHTWYLPDRKSQPQILFVMGHSSQQLLGSSFLIGICSQ